MARTKPRRPARAPAAPAASGPALPARVLRSPIALTALTVGAAAILLYLLPTADLLRGVRDRAAGALGVHVFTLVAAGGAFGALAAAKRTRWLRGRSRVLAAAALLLAFSSGALGLWRPDAAIGGAALAEASAGGALGRWLSGGPPAALAWLLTLPAGLALLWPERARRLLRASPGAAALAGRWLWRRGPRQACAALDARLRRFGEPAGAPGPEELEALRAARAAREAAVAPRALAAADAPPPAADAARDDGEDEAADAGDEEVDEDGRPAVQIPMDMEHEAAGWRHSADGWQLPPLDILRAADAAASDEQDNARRARLIEETLASFGVDAEVTEINEGPAITQFGVEPGWNVRTRTVPERDADGVPLLDGQGRPRTMEVEVSRTRIRVSRITSLQHDLALALAAPALRIEAPVPGKSVIGLEVPNASTSVVTLRGVLESPAFAQASKRRRLPIALGSGVTGVPAVTDLAEMPHLLIAGSTGSGKSVCLNAIIACLLMNYSPEQLRFVLVDPKRVEMVPFADIPHLAFSEIVVDMDKVVGTLQAVIHEMETRYRAFAKVGVRNLQSYNERHEDRPLPYWVVVIDELADLMLAAPYQVEHQLVRLAQLARATGIHLVVATQRPSVDVVTGLIKANFPTRIAFAVSSQVDSRTILDSAGAEKLLGKGDMLYQPKDQGKPTRLQGVYVSDEEIEALVAFWTAGRFEALRPPRFDALLAEAAREAGEIAPDRPPPDTDPMVTEALELARDHEQISTSLLQRRLRIGYPRAARVMDELEQRGVVGPPEGGGGSRPVLGGDGEGAVDAPAVGAAADGPGEG